MLIDIMMPFYGDVDQFMQAVQSVRRQTETSWRLVIIDDRYPSHEPALFVAGLADSRISYVVNESNLGISGNFQRSVDLSEGEYTVIMGCDDIMLPGYVGRLRQLIEQYPEATYIQPGVAVIDDAGAPTNPLGDRVKSYFRPKGTMPLELRGDELATSLLRGNWTYFPSICWKTKDIRNWGFRRDYSIVLDLALQLSIVQAGGSLLLDDEVVFEYRRHRASASSWTAGGPARLAEESALFAEAVGSLTKLGWIRSARSARAHVSSRLNALSHLPAALAGARWREISGILSHALGR